MAGDSITVLSRPLKGVVSVYPDVATGNIQVRWENQEPVAAQVTITDTADHEVLRSVLNIAAGTGQAKIDISPLQPGEYSLTISSDKISFTGRLTILP